MADLVREGPELVVRLTDLERVGALRGDVRVPVSAVTAVSVTRDPFTLVRGLRAPGTGIPGRLLLGTWRYRAGKDFVAVHRGSPGVVVQLAGAPWRRLIVSAQDADAVVERLGLPA